jgi:hypothetical protein
MSSFSKLYIEGLHDLLPVDGNSNTQPMPSSADETVIAK